MKRKILLLTFMLAFAKAGLAVHDEDPGDPSFKIGKNGEVNLKTDVRIGETILKKGKYTVQHRIEANDHMFVFLDLKHEQTIVIRSKAVFPGEKTSESVIHAKEEKDRSARVTKIEMAGENVDHVF